jgi:hypothetical protein
VTSDIVLGGLSALLAFWIFMSALEGLGYAVPVRPSVVVPERWAVGARALIWVVVLGLAASFAIPVMVGVPARLTLFHFLIFAAVALPLWEILAAGTYGDSFVVVNGTQDSVRPVIVAAVKHVFGEMYEDKDVLYSVEPRNQDWQIIPHDKEHLIALDPLYKVDLRKRRALEDTLKAMLKAVRPAGFNQRTFLISFLIPLWAAVLYGGIAYFLLHALASGQPAGIAAR